MSVSEMTDPFAALQNAAKKQKAEEAGAKGISEARSTLVLERSSKGAFFATLAMALKPVPDWTIDTACTDGKLLKYNPEWWSGLSLDMRVGIMAHEVMHCAMKHMSRQGHRDPLKWNIAADLSVNHILVEAGYKLPAGRVLPGEGDFKDMPKGLSAEDYYSRLPNPPPSPSPQDGGDGDGEGDDPGGCGGVEPAGDGSKAAASEAEADWDVKVVQAAEASKKRGKLPAGLERLVGEIKNPKVDWRAVLREFITVQARNDYAWCPPNRRFIWMDLYLPGMRSDELGEIAVAVDTSGSIDEEVLKVFASELQGILDAYSCELTILYHDSEVAGVQKWKSTDGPLVLDPKGGGGTSHIPVFEYIDEYGINPTCLVCLTDMYSEFPSAGPAYPTLWVSTTAGMKAPFGRLVELD